MRQGNFNIAIPVFEWKDVGLPHNYWIYRTILIAGFFVTEFIEYSENLFSVVSARNYYSKHISKSNSTPTNFVQNIIEIPLLVEFQD